MSTNDTNITVSKFDKHQVVKYYGSNVTILNVFFNIKIDSWVYEVRNNTNNFQGVVPESTLSI